MVKRPEIIIPFNYDEGWIGGAYYTTNLISALRLLPANNRPRIWILSQTEDSFEFVRKRTGYPLLQWLGPHLHELLEPGVLWRTRKHHLLPEAWRRKTRFDMVFPYPLDERWQRTACWIPDFQDKRLPEFFSADELAARADQHRYYFQTFRHLVLSSHAAHADFKEFYPDADVTVHVLPFAVFPNADRNEIDFELLRQRYNLPLRYFYCPNQFWIHKNHETVLRAFGLLARRGLKLNIVFSGKEHDPRAPQHSDKMRALAEELGIAENVRFLGFIPRDDQLEIFKHAACIIQPSLFEGWSTVIEDAKSLAQYVLASNIPTHLEQIQTNVEFFDPHNPRALAALITRYAAKDPVRTPVDYSKARLAFARAFMAIAAAVAKENLPYG